MITPLERVAFQEIKSFTAPESQGAVLFVGAGELFLYKVTKRLVKITKDSQNTCLLEFLGYNM